MTIPGLALVAAMLVSNHLTCRSSIEEWSDFLIGFNETLHKQGTSAAGYDYWFFFSENEDPSSDTWTVVVHNLLSPGNYCTGIHMFGKLTDYLPGEVL